MTRSPVGAGALNIEPFSSNPALVNLPLQITIPAGQVSRSFPVGIVNDTLVNGTRNVILSAYALAAGSGGRLGEASPDALTVLDDDGPTLKLVAAKKLVPEGQNPATTIVLSRNTPATNALVVSLTSDDTSEATVPATVTIPSGESSTTFSAASLADGFSDGNQPVVITASAAGFTAGVETLVVSDTDLPDLVVNSLAVPTSGIPQENVPITYRVSNQGVSMATGSFLTRIYLSRDAMVGDDTLVAQFRSGNDLPVGGFFENTVQVALPLEVGKFWVVVETDAEQALAEILEDNNTAISVLPISVAADYAAWVRTDTNVAPAGTAIPLYGRATNSLGAPVSGTGVNVHVLVRGTERILSATTDANGNFAATFTPLPNEGGHYSIFATHPGVKIVPAQDSFDLLGMRANPASVSLTIVEGTTRTGSVSLENLADIPLTGLAVQVVSKPANLQITATLGSSQLSTQTPLNYSLTATTVDAYGTVQLRVTSAEGVTLNITFAVSVEPLRPRLVATPVSLFSAMAVGGQTVVEFDLANLGGKTSGPVTISLPAVPWMHLAITNPMPSLAPGESNHVTLLLTPPQNLQLGPYTGSLALSDGSANLSVPFDFRAVSEARGDLLVDAVDEYTYYAEGAPHLAGATVTVRDAVTRANIASGVTDPNGHFFVGNLMEDYYEIEVTADKHTTFRATQLLKGGMTNEVQTFLSRQTVTYTWTVEPIQIEDRYKITIDTTFETVVPLPVITVSPAFIDLGSLTAPESVVDITIANHGLVAAREMRLEFPAHPCWELKSLIQTIGDLPAETSLTIPVTIRRLAGANCSPCQFSGLVSWILPCGPRVNDYSQAIQVINAGNDCGRPSDPSSIPPLLVGGGGTQSGSSGGSFQAPNVGISTNCLDCGARVKLRIDQDAILTRDAFRATLEIDNNGTSRLENASVEIKVRSENGLPSAELFEVRLEILDTLSAVDGSGILPGNSEGTAKWLILPTVDAAPTQATTYLVSGTLRYQQDGTEVTVPLPDVPITVLPSPRLTLQYFHQRDVFADDPFTDNIEPSIPYSLAVMVQNRGYGLAKNFHIISAQPKIIENEKGLLIDFNIIATEVFKAGGVSNLTPSLTANFGDINAGDTAIGRWLLTSTLQGLFIDYSAKFEHIDGLGNPRLSLIDQVSIHEMNHLVQAGGIWQDGKPDFLVNEVPDIHDYPDTLYQSNGSTNHVEVVEQASIGGTLSSQNLQVTLTAPMRGDWVYLRVPDPGNGQYHLTRARRSDGVEIPVETNVWTTDRTFIGLSKRP
ncbi:MAG: CARDB domain-containing protein, partial [Verrucomicrobiota bacterium]